MKKRISVNTLPLLLLTVAACGPSNLAEAGTRRLSVEEAAQLIAEHSRIPIDTQVVQAVAELWIDYTLLADQVVNDTSLAGLDLTEATRQSLEERMLGRLQEAVIEFDSVIEEDELRRRFAEEMPGARATASHILLAYPPNPSTAQRDSVTKLATELRTRLRNGESFQALVGRYSADPGSARFGGSLGTFDRGTMLPPIDEAVFSLSPGDLSEPVETTLGLHIVRVEAIEGPDFDEAGEVFRAGLIAERKSEAEQAYVEELGRATGLALTDEAKVLARALAENPSAALTERARQRALTTSRDVVYTVGDFRDVIQNSAPGFLESLRRAPDDELETMLQSLGRQRMLIHEAEERGLTPTQPEVDSVEADARALILARARTIGLLGFPGDANESAGPDPALEVALVALRNVISGTQEIVPLAGITFLLRGETNWRIHDEAVETTMSRALEIQSLDAAGSPASSP